MLATAVGTDAHGTRSNAVLRRFSGPARRPAFWAALWAATVAAELVVLVSIVTAEEPIAGFRIVFRLTGGAFAACGLLAWRRRPDSYTGALMVATGFGLLVEPVFAQALELRPGAAEVLLERGGDLRADVLDGLEGLGAGVGDLLE